MKISVKWFLALIAVVAVLVVFQSSLHSQSAGTIKWANGGSCNGSQSCTVTMSWSPSAFSNTNYSATCTPIGLAGNDSFWITSETASQIEIEVWDTSGTGNGASVSSVGCIAVHN